MKSKTILLTLLLIANLISAQNVMISNQNNPHEPAIIIDPKHPNVLVAGANLDNYFLSSDTGQTWTEHQISSSYGVWGDPVIDVDTSSNFYFFHLSNILPNWIDRIVCQKSLDNGNTWSDGTYTGLNGSKAQDKEWSAIDRSNNNIYLTWTQFDAYGSSNPADSSVILFSKSIDGGDTWSNPLRINKLAGDCIDNDNTVEGAVPVIGPNGEIYVSWAGPNGIHFDRSIDEGDTWLVNDILVDSIPGGWAYTIPGLNRCNGLPVTKCDISGGIHHGTIYINWTDQRNGIDDTDVWLSKSTDGGNTWSSPIRVNDDDSGRHQFLTWMAIDQTNGDLFFIFYDRRNYINNQTDVYLAVSKDGGNTFINKRISESPFIPTSGIFFGDYNNIVAHNGIVRPIWTRLNTGNLSIWTDITPLSFILSVNDEFSNLDNNVTQYPNPSTDISYISFKLHESSFISLSLFDQNGKKVYTIFDNQKKEYGKYIVPINLGELRLENGTYYCKLSINDISKTLKMIVIE